MADAPVELNVITRTYDLTVWTCNHVARFNRAHRFTLGDRLARQVDRVLEGLIRARYDPSHRLDLLRQVNIELELLRFLFRLARDLHCLKLNSHEHAFKTVNDIGRMVGAWIKGTATASK